MAMDLMGLHVGGMERGAKEFLWSVKAMSWWREQTRRRMADLALSTRSYSITKLLINDDHSQIIPNRHGPHTGTPWSVPSRAVACRLPGPP